MTLKGKQEPQNPLILRCHRIMEAFAKSNDERDFYIDRMEGFLVYADLDKPYEDLCGLEKELNANKDRYVMIPKLTFYETKKIMEGFINEKVYDIDTKEKLLDIIQSKEARENFLEFVYDHHTEFEKWQQYYQERSRIRIIEWLRNNHFHFVFEEDLDLPKSMIEKLKKNLFQSKVGKDILAARKALSSKAKTYYSNEALNPRPKRGRPPKQAVKLEIEPQVTTDIYTTVPPALRLFLFTPDISSSTGMTFSSKFEGEEDFLSQRKLPSTSKDVTLDDFNNKLASLKNLSSRWMEIEEAKKNVEPEWDNASEFDNEDDEEKPKPSQKKAVKEKTVKKTSEKKQARVAPSRRHEKTKSNTDGVKPSKLKPLTKKTTSPKTVNKASKQTKKPLRTILQSTASSAKKNSKSEVKRKLQPSPKNKK